MTITRPLPPTAETWNQRRACSSKKKNENSFLVPFDSCRASSLQVASTRKKRIPVPTERMEGINHYVNVALSTRINISMRMMSKRNKAGTLKCWHWTTLWKFEFSIWGTPRGKKKKTRKSCARRYIHQWWIMAFVLTIVSSGWFT